MELLHKLCQVITSAIAAATAMWHLVRTVAMVITSSLAAATAIQQLVRAMINLLKG